MEKSIKAAIVTALFERTPAVTSRLIPQALWRFPNLPKDLFLTFDDGPHPEHTPRLLELLDSHDARATFFLVGEKAKTHPEIVRDIIAAGHLVGNHTMHHRQLRWQRRAAVREEIQSAQKVLEDCASTPVRFFRPPHGALSPAILRAAKEHHLRLAMWSLMVGDFLCLHNSKAIANSIMKKSHGGDIILLHDGHPCATATIAALREAIPALKESGYRFNSLPDDFALSKN